MTTLFVSDLHLTRNRPAITELFLEFLQTEACKAEALYILGDLFEYWIGDEAVDADEIRPVIAALRAVADGGVSVYVLHGNRDFLLGERFQQACHCRLLDDPATIDLYGKNTLITHGDQLCTDDAEYQRVRCILRDPAWQSMFLAKEIDEREAIARSYREISMANSSAKPMHIMDVNADAVEQAMITHGVVQMIHGHTHRPDIHEVKIGVRNGRRIVLGDWYKHGSVLRCDQSGCRLDKLPLPAAASPKPE